MRRLFRHDRQRRTPLQTKIGRPCACGMLSSSGRQGTSAAPGQFLPLRLPLQAPIGILICGWTCRDMLSMKAVLSKDHNATSASSLEARANKPATSGVF